jgi:5'-3' exonuclease
MKLLIVDGSNVVMRCAFGGDVPPAQAVTTATHMIARAGRELLATHLVVALDCPGVESWRKKLFPDYKAQRTVDTRPWLETAARRWLALRWWVEAIDGFEADDIIATVAIRAKERAAVTVLSSDSDLLPLSAAGIHIVKPVDGGKFQPMDEPAICARYGVKSSAALVDLKAMTGEKGDNVPGVDGIGPVRAQQLLSAYENVEGVIAAGLLNACKNSAKVAAAAELVRLSFKLVSLVRDVPVVPITPSGCAFDGGAA